MLHRYVLNEWKSHLLVFIYYTKCSSGIWVSSVAPAFDSLIEAVARRNCCFWVRLFVPALHNICRAHIINTHIIFTHNAPAFSGRPTSHRAVPKRHHPSLIAETHVRSRVAFNQSSLRANRFDVVRGRCTRGEGERGCTTTKTTTAHANRFDGWNDQSRNDRNLYEFNRNDRSRCRSVRVRCERIEERIGAVGFAKGELYIAYLNLLMTFFYRNTRTRSRSRTWRIKISWGNVRWRKWFESDEMKKEMIMEK